MSALKQQVRAAVEQQAFEQLEQLVAADPRVVRHLLGLTYRPEPELRQAAARGIAIAGRHHPRLVQKVVRQLVWAMNDESGTNAVTAPAVLVAIASESTELLLPMVPDLIRLTADPGLRPGLAAALRLIRDQHPGEVGARLGDEITHPERQQAAGIERLERYERARKLLHGND